MDKVDRLYEIYSNLAESGDKVAEREADYLEIIEAAKGGAREKGLACQFIPKFLKHFPNLAATALETQLDLVEDEDIAVRKLAVKYLPGFCKVNTNYVPKIADILTQMLITEDSVEQATVQASLVALMEIDIKGTLQGVLTQISTAEEEAVRKRAIEFLNSKLKVLPADLLTKEVEQFFLDSCKTVLPKVSGQDFLSLLPLLSHLKISKTVPVQNAIVDIIASQLDIDADFAISADNITGFMHFLKQACPFFSPFVSSKKFVSYVCLKIFPLLEDVRNLENGSNLILDIFKELAEISAYLQKDDDMKINVEIVYKELLNYMPLPPESVTENEAPDDPKLYFTHIECLLFTFIQFLKHNDEIIMSVDNAARFKDLKLRLQFLSRVISRALKHLRESEKSLVVNEESKLKAIAERTMNNLNTLVKEFFRSPPSFKPTITLSWKPEVHHSRDTGVKRHYEASTSSGNFPKREKRAYREIYVPPSGKYSSRVSFPSKDNTSTGRGGEENKAEMTAYKKRQLKNVEKRSETEFTSMFDHPKTDSCATPVTFNADIGAHIGKQIIDDMQMELLSHPWTPDVSFKFPTSGRRNLRFVLCCLVEWNWLVCSPSQDSAYCKYCSLFSTTVGKQNLCTGKLIKLPYRDCKDAKEDFIIHERTKYHTQYFKKTGLFVDMKSGSIKSIDMTLNTVHQTQAEKNRENFLKPIKRQYSWQEEALHFVVTEILVL